MFSWLKRKKKPECPHCGSQDQVPIVYGLPTGDTFRRADRREVALGGCIISHDSPKWQCRACGIAWGTLDPRVG